MRETYEIRVDNSVYVLDKSFVNMMRSRRSFLWMKVEITDEMLVNWAIEQGKIVERMDLIWGCVK